MGTPRQQVFPKHEQMAAPSDPPTASRSHPSHSVAPESGFATHKRKVTAIQARVIDAMYETLGSLGDHEVLNVRRGADPLEIRCAYESLLAAFHPRRFERTNLGEHAEKLEALIRRIHEAYATLSTEAERASHDARFGKPEP
jgi:DnaJ-domain-containing protein 1